MERDYQTMWFSLNGPPPTPFFEVFSVSSVGPVLVLIGTMVSGFRVKFGFHWNHGFWFRV
jgi:hypothetical protein